MQALSEILVRFWSSMVLGTAAGIAIYGVEIFNPLSPAFKVLTVGATFSGLLALWRCRAHAHAVALAVGYALFCLGFVDAHGWIAASSGIVVGAGLLTITLIYDRLATSVGFGKFLLVGPLLGGLLAAATPMIEYRNLLPLASGDAIVAYAELGLVIGAGVALGAEIVDRMLRRYEQPAGLAG